ncbi:hypothetical protein BHECKSOX_1546 [Bathymodiolus heckerae thiotrophic gill symbiont]|nr:hypothetical protein BHECKSOX_1546 [Bathymodiolus heckerae thiotrophic gill symbiont]
MCPLMKRLLTLFFLLILQGCATQPIYPQQVIISSDIPSEWQLKGRIGVVTQDKAQNFSFKIKFQQQAFDLALTGALGLGQVNIISQVGGLYIDGNISSLSLKQWMDQELGWHFPLQKLADIVFLHQLNIDDNWQVIISKYGPYRETSVAKVVRLTHQRKPIKVKLLLKEITPILD